MFKYSMASLLIGQLAQRADISPPTIRYYGAIGLLPAPSRSTSGYRRYPESAIEQLRFIRRAQALGFSLDEIRDILALSRRGKTPCKEVIAIGDAHVAALDERIDQLRKFRDHLMRHLTKWRGENGASCDGLCAIIASADLPADMLTDAAKPALRRRGTGSARSRAHSRRPQGSLP